MWTLLDLGGVGRNGTGVGREGFRFGLTSFLNGSRELKLFLKFEDVLKALS